MRQLVVLLGIISVMVSFSGCVGVSMHSMHQVRVAVTKESSASPVAGLPLHVIYDYDSYGWFYFFNKPPEATAVTDTQGIATMQLADFRYRILLKIEDKITSLSKQLVLEGGEVSSPPFKVVLMALSFTRSSSLLACIPLSWPSFWSDWTVASRPGHEAPTKP